jgi:pyruvate dehydrogenase E2 component (dihydrolipoamide acetyltransferase)
MAKILDMPKLSPTMEEGVLSAWHKHEGDEVLVDDLLADVETDKATMEFRAFDKGTLLKLLVAAGATVKLGQPVAIVGAAGEDITAVLAQLGAHAAVAEAPRASAAPPAAGVAAVRPSAAPVDDYRSVEVTDDDDDEDASTKTALLPPRMPEAAAPLYVTPTTNVLDRTEFLPEAATRAPSDERVFASPYVRKTARELGVDLAGARGSGPGGRVEAADLEAMRAGPVTGRSPAGQEAGGRQRALAVVAQAPGLLEPEAHPLSMMRKTIARRLTESKQTVPHFYLTIDVDADELSALREDINGELRSASEKGAQGAGSTPLKVSINDLLVKACAVALVRVPACNAQFSPDALLYHRRVDISVAVAVPDGLVTPVVRNADQKSVVAIAGEVRELAARARSKKLTVEEMTNGTFSISNLGMFGVDSFAAVINPPEGAILAVGQVREAAVVRDGALAVGKKMALTLSCDHRVVDGAVGAAFLAELRALLEHPMRILTG